MNFITDMLLSLYRVNLKGRKWYMRIVFWVLGVCVVNSWLVYKARSTQAKKMTLLQFQSRIAAGLIQTGMTPTSRKRGRPSKEATTGVEEPPKRARKQLQLVSDARYDGLGHFPASVPRGRCRLQGCDLYSVLKCTKCNTNLCCKKDKNCFLIYHSK